MKLTDILRCPETGKQLRFDDGDAIVSIEDSGLQYSVVDGIVDFCPGIEDKVSKAYDKLSDRYPGSNESARQS